MNGNNFYDQGEGIGGVRVEIPESTSYTVSSRHGAFSADIPGNGTYNVIFSPPNSDPITKTISVTNNRNVKLDYKGETSRVINVSAKRTNNAQSITFSMQATPGSTFQLTRSGDMRFWTNTPSTSTVTNGIVQVSPQAAYSGQMFFRVSTVWTNQ